MLICGREVDVSTAGAGPRKAAHPFDKLLLLLRRACLAVQSKPVTAVAAMILVDEGKLKLTDPIHMWNPRFKDLKVESTDYWTGEHTEIGRLEPLKVRPLQVRRQDTCSPARSRLWRAVTREGRG